MIEKNDFFKNFNLMSLLPITIFILGLFIIYYFIQNDYGKGIFIMMFAFIIYLINNIINHVKKYESLFNQYLEDMSVFFTFGITTILFGFLFYIENEYLLLIVSFYSFCILIGLARTFILEIKNYKGWPVALNGVFFPTIFYINIFYLGEIGESIYLLYYILIGIFAVSNIKFLGYKTEDLDKIENNKEKEEENPKIKEEDELEDKELNREIANVEKNLDLNNKKQKEISQKVNELLNQIQIKK